MIVGTPVILTDTNRYGYVHAFGPKGPDGDSLVTIMEENRNLVFAWRSEFVATDVRTVDGLMWAVAK